MTQPLDENTTELNITLTITDVNKLLAILGKYPFDEINALIGKIYAQGEAQIKELLPPEESAE
jgi:hypothetical protein